MHVYAGFIGLPYEMVWGCSSAGEHFVDIEGVTGSIPVTPTISSKILLKQSVSFDAEVTSPEASAGLFQFKVYRVRIY
jgi:hypothetical protein